VKFSRLITVLAAAFMAASSFSLAADGAQPWHFTYQIGGVDLDSDRNTEDGDVWQGLGFGYFFNNNFSLDFEYDEFDGDFRGFDTAVPGATFDSWEFRSYSLMGRYFFGDRAFRPFVLGGLGATDHRSVLDEGTDLSLNVGVGLHGQLAKHFSVRAQGLLRYDQDGSSIQDRSNFKDFIYSLGISYDFGGRTPRAEPAAAAPPPPPRPAAPPNPDLDGDGVPNERDKCPNTRPGAVVDLDGCEVEAVIDLKGVYFDFDKATLRPEGIAVLNDAAALLKTNERVVVEVAGHTDSVGSEPYNQALSERRANTVKDYLTSQGVTATRLTARGYGEVQPVATNDTDAGRQLNRRVELIVLDR